MLCGFSRRKMQRDKRRRGGGGVEGTISGGRRAMVLRTEATMSARR